MLRGLATFLLLIPYCGLSAQDPLLILTIPVWTNNQVQFTFAGESGVTYIVESSEDLQNWIPVSTNSDSAITRVVTLDASFRANVSFYRASRARVPTFVAGLIAKQNINLNGNSIYVDAYDSADTVLFPGGFYNATNAFADGDIATQAGLLLIGNTALHGRLFMGPGGSYSLGPYGLVGDMAANWPAQMGVESPVSDWLLSNFNFEMPDVSPPYTDGLAIQYINSSNTFYLSSGSYYLEGDLTLLNGQTLYAAGTVDLYVTGILNAKIGSTLSIAPGAALKLYVGNQSGTPTA